LTVWILPGGQGDLTAAGRYLVSLLNRRGYRARLKDLSADPTAGGQFADSQTKAQAAVLFLYTPYLSASQVIDRRACCSTNSGSMRECVALALKSL
jgi:hypothetical protein